nr:VanZ family protein [Lysobacter antarcticus]
MLAVLAFGVAILLARGSHPLIGTLLIVSALTVSALLFLPTGMLVDWLGIERVNRLLDQTSPTPLDLSDWIHFSAFAWLGLLIWLARGEVRNGRGVMLVAALGIAAEVSQWLTDGRQPKVEDAVLNVAGGMVGLLAGILLAKLWRNLTKAGERI